MVTVLAPALEHVWLKISELFLHLFHVQENLNRQKAVPSGVAQVDDTTFGLLMHNPFNLKIYGKRVRLQVAPW